MSTPHIRAEKGQIADRVIMPGDPKRAERIATQHLSDAVLVTDVRGILGFTGHHNGRPVTVMASGMGMPSLTIYATELAREYGVRQIVRVGTAGGLTERVRLGDVVIASGAHTDSAMTRGRVPGVSLSHIPDFALAANAVQHANARVPDGNTVHVGAVLTTDHFYLERPELMRALAAHGALATEMEAAGLYAVGMAESIRTLAIVTISDHLLTGEEMSSEDREARFQTALSIALAV
ncbi:purine-nucleoside phosphorylase [Microbacterium hominis]|uniref:Uridine phosphorylase n=1 Tax=Microbacterium hominis TaxID=162426 RepID=A0A7D4TPI1_9MICO|nr:purine-nucleoside phosphorylase [Microbacterium hominis]QKJ18244.1 purine-nucleoside phosphorylase [Microbacterium hominis]